MALGGYHPSVGRKKRDEVRERERREEKKQQYVHLSQETQVLNARPRSRDEGRPVERPFPPFAPSLSFLSVSATVSRNGYARARNTKGCVAFFSFLLSLPSSSRAVSLSLLAFRIRARSLIFAKGGGRRHFSHSNRPEARARGQPHAICPRSVCMCVYVIIGESRDSRCASVGDSRPTGI